MGPKDTLVVVYNPQFLDMRELMEMVVDKVPTRVAKGGCTVTFQLGSRLGHRSNRESDELTWSTDVP